MSELTGWSFVEEDQDQDQDQVSNLGGYDFEEEGQAVSDKFILDKVGNPLYENPTKAEYLAYEAARDREDVPFVKSVGEAAEMAWRDITGFFSGLVDLAEKGEYTEAGKALVEGGVRGTSDLGTLVRKGIYDNVKYAMGDEDDDYQNFLAARKLDAMRERARLGDQGLVFDLIPEANKVAEGFSYVADPSVLIPGAGLATKATTKVGSLASRGAGEVLSLGGRALSYPAQRIGDAATGVAEAVGAATMKSPGLGAATAQSAGKLGSGLQTMGELFSEVGQQMTKRPSQMGLMKSIEYSAEASEAVRKYAGRSARFLDPALSVMGRAVEGVGTGAAVGGTLGLVAEGERGLYSGIGAGGVLGGTATGIGIVAGKVTGVTQKNRIRNDFNRWLNTLPEDQAKRVANTVGKDTNAMAELVGADALAVGAFGKDTIVEFLDSKGVAERRADYHRRETGEEISPEVFEKDNLHGVHFIDLTTDGQRPTVLINTDYKSNPGHTMVHEVFHAINRLDGMGDYTSRLYSGIIGTFVEAGQIKPGLLTPEQFNSIADQYASRFLVKAEKGGLELKDKAGKFTLDSIDKYNSIKGDKKVILEEIGAELFAALLTGKGKASYLVPGKGIDTLTRTYLDRLLMADAESRLGRMANMLENIYSGLRFDRVTGDTMFTVDGAPLKADPQLNAIMRDMVRAKRAIRTTMDVAAGDKKVTVIKPRTVGSRGVKKLHDLVKDTPVEAIFETDSKGRSKVKKAEETHKAEVEQSKKIIDAVAKAPDDGKAGTVRRTVNEKGEEVLVGQRFSPEQIEEIKKIPGINNKVVQYLEMLNEIMASGRQIDIEYYAASRLNRKGQRAYSSGIKHTRRHVVPYSIEISASGNFFVKSLDVNKLAGKVDQWKKSRKAWLKNWTNMDEFYSDVARYLQNLASPEPKQSSKLFGETKRNILNELMGARGRKGFNPLALEKVAEKDFLIRSFRVDRVTEMNADSSLSPIKADLPYSEQSYTLQKENFMPAEPPTFKPDQITTLDSKTLENFMPAPGINNPDKAISDITGERVQVLTTDSSTAETLAVNGIHIPFKGGIEYLENNSAWGFTEEKAAKAFRTRWEREGRPLIGLTTMKPDNHINQILSREYYSNLLMQEAAKGNITKAELDNHIQAAMQKLIDGKTAAETVKDQAANIKNIEDFAEWFPTMAWSNAPIVYKEMFGSTKPRRRIKLPIDYDVQKKLGIDRESLAFATRAKALHGVERGTLIAVAEYNGADSVYRPELNKAYPWSIPLNNKAFLKDMVSIKKLTSDKDAFTKKSGEPNIGVLMGKGVILDKLESGELYKPADSVGSLKVKSTEEGARIIKTNQGKFRVYGANKSLLGVASSEKAAERLLRGGVKKNNIRQRPTRGLSR